MTRKRTVGHFGPLRNLPQLRESCMIIAVKTLLNSIACSQELVFLKEVATSGNVLSLPAFLQVNQSEFSDPPAPINLKEAQTSSDSVCHILQSEVMEVVAANKPHFLDSLQTI